MEFSKGRVSGWNKPNDSNYLYLLPPAHDSAEAASAQAEPCPAVGISACKSNWDLIRQGVTKLQIEAILGKPESIENVSVSQDRITETWKYPLGASIGMLNGIVTQFTRPTSYRYHAPPAVIETGAPAKSGEQNI